MYLKIAGEALYELLIARIRKSVRSNEKEIMNASKSKSVGNCHRNVMAVADDGCARVRLIRGTFRRSLVTSDKVLELLKFTQSLIRLTFRVYKNQPKCTSQLFTAYPVNYKRE